MKKMNPREFYVTPPHTVEAIRPHLHNYLRISPEPRVINYLRISPEPRVINSIIDAGCGSGALAPLVDIYANVTRIGMDIRFPDQRPSGYDVLLEQDFLKSDLRANMIVMNPPFSLAVDFVRHARLLSPVVVALLPLSCLAPKKYESIFGGDCNFDIYVLGKRPAFTYPGSTGSSAKFECAWFVWHQGLDEKIRRICLDEKIRRI